MPAAAAAAFNILVDDQDAYGAPAKLHRNQRQLHRNQSSRCVLAHMGPDSWQNLYLSMAKLLPKDKTFISWQNAYFFLAKPSPKGKTFISWQNVFFSWLNLYLSTKLFSPLAKSLFVDKTFLLFS